MGALRGPQERCEGWGALGIKVESKDRAPRRGIYNMGN